LAPVASGVDWLLCCGARPASLGGLDCDGPVPLFDVPVD
jgi:hypothetical protein